MPRLSLLSLLSLLLACAGEPSSGTRSDGPGDGGALTDASALPGDDDADGAVLVADGGLVDSGPRFYLDGAPHICGLDRGVTPRLSGEVALGCDGTAESPWTVELAQPLDGRVHPALQGFSLFRQPVLRFDPSGAPSAIAQLRVIGHPYYGPGGTWYSDDLPPRTWGLSADAVFANARASGGWHADLSVDLDIDGVCREGGGNYIGGDSLTRYALGPSVVIASFTRYENLLSDSPVAEPRPRFAGERVAGASRTTLSRAEQGERLARGVAISPSRRVYLFEPRGDLIRYQCTVIDDDASFWGSSFDGPAFGLGDSGLGPVGVEALQYFGGRDGVHGFATVSTSSGDKRLLHFREIDDCALELDPSPVGELDDIDPFLRPVHAFASNARGDLAVVVERRTPDTFSRALLVREAGSASWTPYLDLPSALDAYFLQIALDGEGRLRMLATTDRAPTLYALDAGALHRLGTIEAPRIAGVERSRFASVAEFAAVGTAPGDPPVSMTPDEPYGRGESVGFDVAEDGTIGALIAAYGDAGHRKLGGLYYATCRAGDACFCMQ